jgi:hypothetical protein
MKYLPVKKIMLLMAVAGALFSCSESVDCSGYTTPSNITISRSELMINNVPVQPDYIVSPADIRLKMFCEFVPSTPDTPQGAEECFPINEGLATPLRSISVSCDRTVANIPAGEDLIAIITPRVYTNGSNDLSVPEWIESLNRGDFTMYTRYEFDFEFLPYYLTIEEGDYTFTIKIKGDSGGNLYEREFPAVHLRATPPPDAR